MTANTTYITNFKRTEKKYLITTQQMTTLLNEFYPFVVENEYGQSKVASVYFDDDLFDLIHTSVEKPVYKEKLRIRCYGTADENTTCFAEIKKKYDGTVYKRRVSAPLNQIMSLVGDGTRIDGQSEQIQREILWMVNRYNLKAKIWVGCDRRAFEGVSDNELRITFDSNLEYQTYNPSLTYQGRGKPIIDSDLHIMEIKYDKGLPMWLVKTLDENKIYPRGFSKVGTALTNIFTEEQTEDTEEIIGEYNA